MRFNVRFLFALLMVVSLAACNSSNDNNSLSTDGGGDGGSVGDGGDDGGGDDGGGDGGDDDVDGAGGGTAHEMMITYPIEDAIVDTDDGLYARRVTVTVSNEEGEPVPDGTRVRLGVIDSVFAYGVEGSTTADGNQFAATNHFHGDDFLNTLWRQHRVLDASDATLLLRQADFQDRRRPVDAVTGPDSIDVPEAYAETEDGLQYWLGVSAFGTSILDDSGGSLANNELVTQNGKATFQIRYPVREEGVPLLGMGCGGYNADGTYHREDGRFPDNPYSGQVLVYAEVLDNLQEGMSRYTAVDRSFCYSWIAGGSCEVAPGNPDSLELGADDSATVGFVARDGSGSRIPYAPFEAAVMGLDGVDATIVDGRTDGQGEGQVTITASAASGSGEVVVYDRTGDLELSIDVTIQ